MPPMRCLVALALLAGCRDVHAVADASSGPGDCAVSDTAIDTPTDPVDGAPARLPCTGTFGTALTSSGFGRLDGFLVAIVRPAGAGAATQTQITCTCKSRSTARST